MESAEPPPQEVEQNFSPDRDSIVNAGLNQTNKQPQANPTVKFTVKACENIDGKKPVVKRPQWQEGCPYCTAMPKSYNLYRKHVAYECQNLPSFLQNQTKQ